MWIPRKGGSLPSDLGGFVTYTLIFFWRYLFFHSRIYWLTPLIHGVREGWQGAEHGLRLFASKTTQKRRIARLWVWESEKSNLHSGLKRWFARNKEVKRVTSPSRKKMHRMQTVLSVRVYDRELVQTGGKNSHGSTRQLRLEEWARHFNRLRETQACEVITKQEPSRFFKKVQSKPQLHPVCSHWMVCNETKQK